MLGWQQKRHDIVELDTVTGQAVKFAVIFKHTKEHLFVIVQVTPCTCFQRPHEMSLFNKNVKFTQSMLNTVYCSWPDD